MRLFQEADLATVGMGGVAPQKVNCETTAIYKCTFGFIWYVVLVQCEEKSLSSNIIFFYRIIFNHIVRT